MFTGLSLLTMGLGSLPDMEMLLYVISLAETNAFHGIIAGILTTFLCQSSSAATAILMALADEDLINITTAAYIVYGNNIGSCLSSVVVSTVAPPAAKRVALSHVLLNILGVLLFLPVTNAMTALTLWFASDFASQIAIFHTLFNIISSLLVLPFLRQFSRLIEILVPSKKIR
jgi:phosphate:Na+ symporter